MRVVVYKSVWLVVITLGLLLSACGGTETPGPGPGDPAVTSVEITGVPSPAQVQIGATVDLNATVNGDSGVSQDVTWTSSDAALATVNTDGVVTGVSAGSVSITATSDADSTKSDTETLTIVSAPTTVDCTNAGELPATIDAAQTLPLNCFKITRTVAVKAALTLAPGTVIVAEPNGYLDIQAGGALIAKGTAANPIIMRGENPSKGYWYGVNIASLNDLNQLDYVQISDGGRTSSYSNLLVQNTGSVSISNSTFSNSRTDGVRLETGAQLNTFANNTFEVNGQTALEVPAALIHKLDAASNYAGASGKGNVESVIDVLGGAITSGETQTWPATNAPFRLTGTVDVEGNVTVSAGASFVAEPNGYIDVKGGGSFKAIGTEDARISFKGENASAGYWYGINVSANTDNEFSYVDISEGGRTSSYSNLLVSSGGKVSLSNSSFTNSRTDAVVVRSGGEIASFSDNRFATSETAIEIPASLIGVMDSDSDYGTNHTDNVISVDAANVVTNQTWAATNIPFRLNGSVNIQADVVVSPGAQFVAKQNGYVDVQTGGSLKAIGTATNPISFRGENSSKGYWYGINFASNNSDNQLSFVEIADGGRTSSYANVLVSSSGSLNMTNSTVTNSRTFGLIARSGAVVTPATTVEMIAQNSFSNNGDDGTAAVNGLP